MIGVVCDRFGPRYCESSMPCPCCLTLHAPCAPLGPPRGQDRLCAAGICTLPITYPPLVHAHLACALLCKHLQYEAHDTAGHRVFIKRVHVRGQSPLPWMLCPISEQHPLRPCDAAAYAYLLAATAIPVFCMSMVTNAGGYIVERLFIGCSLAAFVVCQFWSSIMFSPTVVGMANAIAGGWGNAGTRSPLCPWPAHARMHAAVTHSVRPAARLL